MRECTACSVCLEGCVNNLRIFALGDCTGAQSVGVVA
jgi:hypothetical protein